MKIRDVLRGKLKEKQGFTLAEMLVTLLILLMVSSVVAMGVPSAVRAYSKVVDADNAQLLLSTTVTQLRRELSLAKEVKLQSGSTDVQYYINGENGRRTELVNDSEGIARSWTELSNSKQLLVSPEAATPNMISSIGGLTYDEGVFTISNLSINKEGYNNTPLAKLATLEIRAVNVKKITADS